jgi:hypothetical protein
MSPIRGSVLVLLPKGFFSYEELPVISNISRQENICAPSLSVAATRFQRRNVSSGFFLAPKYGRPADAWLSTQKIAENSQNPPLICLTELWPISISCGQGSGHPHPVVVDNVSGSFGNLVSPETFRRR